MINVVQFHERFVHMSSSFFNKVSLWVITTGLKPGERVVAVGAEKAKEGELVNPTPYKETEER